MKRVLCAAALALGLGGCSAIDVKGIVRDEDTGEPLPGAAVRIGDESTTTDLTGYYELEVDEEDGEPQQVHVTKSGYTGFAEQVAFDEDADEVFQDVELKKADRDGRGRAKTDSKEGGEAEEGGSLETESEDD